jgi:hypothetical protein
MPSLRPRVAMRRVRFRVWMIMAVVALSAGALAEMRQRRERLGRLYLAHLDIAHRHGWVRCGHGASVPRSIEDDRKIEYHLDLANVYQNARNRRWLLLSLVLPPPSGFRDAAGLAEWGLEAMLEAIPLSGVPVVLLILHAASTTPVKCHG